eukprot:4612663-Amphidinium_carterae.1
MLVVLVCPPLPWSLLTCKNCSQSESREARFFQVRCSCKPLKLRAQQLLNHLYLTGVATSPWLKLIQCHSKPHPLQVLTHPASRTTKLRMEA